MNITLSQATAFYLILIIGATFHAHSDTNPEPLLSFTHDELYSPSPALNEKLRRAIRQGFFYVEIPPMTKDLIPEAVNFAHSFYKNPQFKEAALSHVTTFHDFPHAQFESFFCEQPYWSIYPEAIQICANSLIDLSLTLLRNIMPLVLPQLSSQDWAPATGGLFGGKGNYFFSFNHYRPEKKMIGLIPHQDTGYITLLFIDKKGLYGFINNKWCSIDPKPGFFIVNLGRALEMLVNDTSKLVASWHFVERITAEKHGGDRISFGLFSDNHPETPVMAASPDGRLITKYQTYSQYLDEYKAEVKNKIIEIPPIEDIA